MASVFRRRVLKWYFIQTLFFSPGLTHAKLFRAERREKKATSCEKVFMHSIYILINSHVRTHRRKHIKSFLSSAKTHVWKVRNVAKHETAFPGVSIFCTLSSVALWCTSWQTTLFLCIFLTFLATRARSRFLRDKLIANAKIGKRQIQKWVVLCRRLHRRQ